MKVGELEYYTYGHCDHEHRERKATHVYIEKQYGEWCCFAVCRDCLVEMRNAVIKHGLFFLTNKLLGEIKLVFEPTYYRKKNPKLAEYLLERNKLESKRTT